jgi:glycolate oxidase iron-sulfur subunit
MTLETAAPAAPHAHSLHDDLSRCIHCGFCLQACPTYLDLGLEADSPRGRIQIIAAIEDGRAQPTPSLLGHLDLCLQCRACETACPSGVAYGRIMEAARARIVERPDPPLTWRLRIAAMREVLPHPARLRTATAALRLYQRSPVRRLVRRSGILRRLPGNLASAEASLPEMPRRPFSPPAQPAGLTHTVAMLTGCVMPHMYPRTHEATVRVLNRLGFHVVFPERQTCCGALNLHGGDRVFARDLARRNIDAFLAARVEAVIVDSAGCGSMMKEYGELLAQDAAYRERARRLATLTKDVLEFVAEHDLGELGPVAEWRRIVTYQDSCHLVHAQKVTQAPRAILRQIPGLDLREMAAPDRCCGSAGLYSFVQRGMSGRLLRSKMDDVAATGASCVATANPGCMSQLEAGLRLSDMRGEVVHVIELLDESMRAAGRAGQR